jgi:2-dehydro-3-deoxyphosphogluconate aldolase/(4S)-4-hydroxy-2-oxoglutarate aldolase
MMDIEEVMRLGPVMPVLVIEDAAHAQPIARALVAGGLRALEVTLRTPSALEAIAEMNRIEGAAVGAGTVLNAAQLRGSIDAGALAEAVCEVGVPYLPGVATAGDIMRGMDLGLSHFKFFPAEAAGGRAALKSLSAPFFQARFCPTGGVSEANASDWLTMPSVLCVGGSWLVPPGPPDTAAITARARQAMRWARP